MSEIQYIERVPRRSDFCGCPPCPICYDPVITDEQQAPTFQDKMEQIYGEGPMPQTEQEYEWAHVAAHQCRQELKASPKGDFFEAAQAKMTQMQIDDLLKRQKKAREAPKPLNTVNLDDMAAEAISTPEPASEVPEDNFKKIEYAAREARARARAQEEILTSKMPAIAALNQQVNLQSYYNYEVIAVSPDSGPQNSDSRRWR